MSRKSSGAGTETNPLKKPPKAAGPEAAAHPSSPSPRPSPPVGERGVSRAESFLVLGSIAFFLALLVVGELVARSLDSTRPVDPTALGTLHRYSETYGWEPRPGIVLRLDDRVVSINEDGHSGRAYPRERDLDRPRILMLGDSITFGLDVGDHATFSMLLDVARPDWDVINRGVQGYGTDQELLLLENAGIGYSPDVVVLNFCVANDFVDNSLDRFLYDGKHPKPYFRIEKGELRLQAAHLRLGWTETAARRLLESSSLFRIAVERGAARRAGEAGRHWTRSMLQVTQNPVPAVQLTSALIREIGDLGRSAGAKLIIVAHPFSRSWREGSEMLDQLRGPLTSVGDSDSAARWVDLAQVYRERDLDFEALTLDKLGHLNATGHQAVADILGERLEALLSETPSEGSSPPH